MRVFAVSAVSIGLLAVLAPMGAMGATKPVTGAPTKPKIRKPKPAATNPSAANTTPVTPPVADPAATTNVVPPAFNFETASMGEKVVFLSTHGEHKAAIEHFLAMPNDAAKLATDVVGAYGASMVAHVTFVGPQGAEWDSFSDAEKVRAFWAAGQYDDVIALYESSEACKTDSQATAAFLDAKLKKAVQANVEAAQANPAV